MTSKVIKTFVAMGAICTSLTLVGCEDSVQKAQPLKPGDYAAILPYETSDTRGKHIGLIADIDIRTQMEKGLMDISKAYFSPDEVAYKNHAFLDYDEIDASDGSRGLLGTLRDGNPNGLNPSANEEFDTGNGVVKGPILVVDLYELDFYTNNDLKGISIGLAVTDAVEDDQGNRIEITQEKLDEYLNATGSKIVSYMRERFNEITPNIPILIAAYQLNTNEEISSKGGYVFTEYFTQHRSSTDVVSEEYYLLPSTTFTEAQADMTYQFETFRQDVATILTDTTYTVGQAKVHNGSVQRLDITINAHGKTVGEVLAVVQYVRERMDIFESQDCEYTVIIKNNDETCALMKRAADSTKVEVITVY